VTGNWLSLYVQIHTYPCILSYTSTFLCFFVWSKLKKIFISVYYHKPDIMEGVGGQSFCSRVIQPVEIRECQDPRPVSKSTPVYFKSTIVASRQAYIIPSISSIHQLVKPHVKMNLSLLRDASTINPSSYVRTKHRF
jgi:hypothetical protein